MRAEAADDILRTYLHVRDGGGVDRLEAGAEFWPALAAGKLPHLDAGRLMSAFTFTGAWETWERHPAGEELVMLLSGEVTLTLEQAGGEHRVALKSAGEYVLIPAGTWHTASSDVESALLFLTPGAGTEHRPVK
jgi:oxalate decarboxylase/phosphoglucose isomerase-like protein (cupin superfamily)